MRAIKYHLQPLLFIKKSNLNTMIYLVCIVLLVLIPKVRLKKDKHETYFSLTGLFYLFEFEKVIFLDETIYFCNVFVRKNPFCTNKNIPYDKPQKISNCWNRVFSKEF
jgi:hypothetical protein